MSTPLRKGIVVCEELDLIGYFRKHLHDINCAPSILLRSHNLRGAIVVVKSNLDEAYWKWGKSYEYVKERSLLTGRMMPDESVPLQQPPNTIILPWCSENAFVNWVALLLGVPNITVCPEWFFFRNTQSDSRKTVHNLLTVLQYLHTWGFHEIKSANIAEKVGCSKRYLEKVFDELFGVMPGQLFRGWQNFAITANLMYKEKELECASHCRRGFSPLAELESDYRRTLQKLLGITYTELRYAATREHWAVVWMRKWRERYFRY